MTLLKTLAVSIGPPLSDPGPKKFLARWLRAGSSSPIRRLYKCYECQCLDARLLRSTQLTRQSPESLQPPSQSSPVATIIHTISRIRHSMVSPRVTTSMAGHHVICITRHKDVHCSLVIWYEGNVLYMSADTACSTCQHLTNIPKFTVAIKPKPTTIFSKRLGCS